MPSGPTVFVLLPNQISYARKIMRGVRAYADAHCTWWVRCGTVPKVEVLRKLNPGPDGGIIGFFSQRDQEAVVVEEHKVAAVNVSFRLPQSRLPRVIAGSEEAGRRAAQHLLERGFRHFAFAGPLELAYAEARQRGFRETLTEAGFNVNTAPTKIEQRHAWLEGLPKPVGVLGADDREAERLVDFCGELDIAVPEEVAVIGVDNDADTCEASHIPLTSVDTRGYEVGYRAAALLASLMAGEPPPTEPVLIPCGEVVVRRSTDTVAVDDPDLAFTMRYIREHACDPLRIDEIMEHLTIARRSLERRFKATFGRTLHDEIRRVQLERARELLTMTDLLVPEVAHRVGFADDRMFTKVFGKAIGVPPGRYRHENRRR